MTIECSRQTCALCFSYSSDTNHKQRHSTCQIFSWLAPTALWSKNKQTIRLFLSLSHVMSFDLNIYTKLAVDRDKPLIAQIINSCSWNKIIPKFRFVNKCLLPEHQPHEKDKLLLQYCKSSNIQQLIILVAIQRRYTLFPPNYQE